MAQALRLSGILFVIIWVLGLFFPPFLCAAESRPLRIVAFGDSLTAGFGLPVNQAFPAVLETTLREKGYNVTIINAGLSGDTTSGGLARLDWSIPDGTDAVILELGANDMLRGLDPSIPAQALDTILARLKQRKIAVLLTGMRAAPNLGPEYAAKFDKIYTNLGEKYDLVVYPFFMDGVAGNQSLLLPDGIHPSETGVRTLVERILPTVEQFIATLPSSK